MYAGDVNLTGEQIQTILDTFLYKALEPIIQNTNAFDVQVAHLLVVITKNKKRKISSIDRERAISNLCNYLACTDPAQKLAYLRATKIERSFIHVFIRKFLMEYRHYVDMYWQSFLEPSVPKKRDIRSRLRVLTRDIGADSCSTLFHTLPNSTEPLGQFYKYREGVVSNYVRLVYKQAKAYCTVHRGRNYDFNDVSQNFFQALLRAIDKYDSSKGALTSYMDFWILNAKTGAVASHEYGIAFTMSQEQRKRVAQSKSNQENFSVSLDSLKSAASGAGGSESEASLINFIDSEDPAPDELAEGQEETKIIQYLAKCADLNSCARLYLDIDEVFTDEELHSMREHMRTERVSKRRRIPA